ncbi:expressed unknown protein [Seminavis robusta]|uniref:Uncharacterized protein n=1 Tax=Seminavis robusta TaxID=568900 RepID=A0A9N8HA27_9STRA|nr:expressed unknown protein [Seminavis robusta]|eukprot:Sro134_g063480.1 n/a (304) ;mRNA; r:57294-58205
MVLLSLQLRVPPGIEHRLNEQQQTPSHNSTSEALVVDTAVKGAGVAGEQDPEDKTPNTDAVGAASLSDGIPVPKTRQKKKTPKTTSATPGVSAVAAAKSTGLEQQGKQRAKGAKGTTAQVTVPKSRKKTKKMNDGGGAKTDIDRYQAAGTPQNRQHKTAQTNSSRRQQSREAMRAKRDTVLPDRTNPPPTASRAVLVEDSSDKDRSHTALVGMFQLDEPAPGMEIENEFVLHEARQQDAPVPLQSHEPPSSFLVEAILVEESGTSSDTEKGNDIFMSETPILIAEKVSGFADLRRLFYLGFLF